LTLLNQAGRKAEKKSWKGSIFRTSKRMTIFLFLYGLINITRNLMLIVQIAQGQTELNPVSMTFYTLFTNTTGLLHMAVFGTTKEPYLATRRVFKSSQSLSNNNDISN
jgi:hypothetical protein